MLIKIYQNKNIYKNSVMSLIEIPFSKEFRHHKKDGCLNCDI